MRKTIPMFAATVCAALFVSALSLTFVGIDARPAAAANTTYTPEVLGSFEANEGQSIARGVNTSDQVVGQAQKRFPNVTPPLQLRPFFWDGGSIEDLGTLGGPSGAARGINDSGQTVGFSRPLATSNQQQAFVTETGADGTTQLVALGALPGFPSSEAFAINESGQIVGRSSILPTSGSLIRSGRAFLYRKNENGVWVMDNLGVLSEGDAYSEAWAINDSGQVVGESGTNEDQGKAFLYSDGSMKGLGTLPDQPYSEAFGINNSGQIVGWSYSSRTAVQGRAFIYRNGKMEDLGTLPGDGTLQEDPYSMARAIDDHGRVVGQSRAASGQNPNRAFLWEDGVMTDLNTLIPADPSLKLLDAYAISESGKIVGSAIKNGLVRPFVLTPNDASAPNTTRTVSPGPDVAGWNNEDVTVTLDATDEGGSNVKEISYSINGDANTVHGDRATFDITTEGENTITYFATDNAGNAEETETFVVGIDKTGPEVNIATPPDGAEYLLGETVAAKYTCPDAGSGLDSCVGTVPDGASIDTASVGQKTFTVRAWDKVDNFTSESSMYSVVYDFDGFFNPVNNPDVLNRAKAGSAIPVKFSLGGDQGLDIFAEKDGFSFPRSGPIPCAATDPIDTVEQTVTANSSGLTYDASTNVYTYVWKTQRNWTGCRQLVVSLDDGKEYTANFEFFK
jgi:probable HAF family extracellular repeat protein